MGQQGRPAFCRRRGNATLPALAAVLVSLGAPPLRAAAEECAAWPGEPAPLPTQASPDAILSRWASLRAKELVAAAAAAPPAEARVLWQHVRCLDPNSAEAARALEQIHAVSVYRPEVVAVVARRNEAAGPVAIPDLGAPIRVALAPVPERPAAPPPRTPAPAPAAAPPDWGRTDAALREAEASLRGADFERALKGAEGVRRDLQGQASAPGAGERRARAEVLAATAEVALGRDEAARRSFERALAANPRLELDPARTSPKVRRVFDAARAAQGAKP